MVPPRFDVHPAAVKASDVVEQFVATAPNC
jgi:hypothetical protein